MEYGNEVITTANHNYLWELDKTQNIMLHFINRAPTYTMTATMKMQTGISLLHIRRGKAVLKFWEQNTRVYNKH
jgi:hypothetical protein